MGADTATTLDGDKAKRIQTPHQEYSVDKSSMQRNSTIHHQDGGKAVVNYSFPVQMGTN